MSDHVIWETRDFRKVRILCTDKPGPFPIVGYFIGAKEPESLDWMHDGRLLDHREDYSDLVIPEGAVIGDIND